MTSLVYSSTKAYDMVSIYFMNGDTLYKQLQLPNLETKCLKTAKILYTYSAFHTAPCQKNKAHVNVVMKYYEQCYIVDRSQLLE